MSDSGGKIGDSLNDHHYSGDNSTNWWRRIRKTKDSDLYKRACGLQTLEAEVLRRLDLLERGTKP